MIDHISLQVSDLAKSTAFYEAVLEPLGLVKMFAIDNPSPSASAIRSSG